MSDEANLWWPREYQPKSKAHGQITDSTIARIAGNIVGHLLHAHSVDPYESRDEVERSLVRSAVRLARGIAAEVERTRG